MDKEGQERVQAPSRDNGAEGERAGGSHGYVVAHALVATKSTSKVRRQADELREDDIQLSKHPSAQDNWFAGMHISTAVHRIRNTSLSAPPPPPLLLLAEAHLLVSTTTALPAITVLVLLVRSTTSTSTSTVTDLQLLKQVET
jgi:hypothetical protein